MKILVTGGAGFIGSHVANAYIDAGHDVFVVDNVSTGNLEYLPKQARFYQIDVRNPALWDVFERERPEIVSHHAGLSSVRDSFENPVEYADVNVLGSLRVLECARRSSVKRVVYASTGGAGYGQPAVLPVPEDFPMHPLDPYGMTKVHVEHYLAIYRKSFGLDFTALRYANVYGPRQNARGESGVVAIFLDALAQGRPPIINGDGEQKRDFVFVDDVVRANVLALAAGSGRTFNIGTGIGTSINQLHALLRDTTGLRQPPDYGPPKSGEVLHIYLDCARASEELAWFPRFTLRDGLARTWANIQQETFTDIAPKSRRM